MKKSILAITVLILFSIVSYSQSDFTVDNQTDCDVNVTIEAYAGVCDNCGGSTGTTGGTATANTQTQITQGGGQGGEWGSIVITISGGGGSSSDGTCVGASGSVVCNSEDIYVVWLDCSNAEVKKQ